MARGKSGLGRGLDALLGGIPEDAAQTNPLMSQAETGDAVVSIRLGDIDPNRDQPRRRFDEEALEELAASIRAVGVLPGSTRFPPSCATGTR